MEACQLSEDGKGDILHDTPDHDQRLAPPVLRGESQAEPDGVGWLAYADHLPIDQHSTRRHRQIAKEDLRQLGTARADQTGQSDHLAGMYVEGDSPMPGAA